MHMHNSYATISANLNIKPEGDIEGKGQISLYNLWLIQLHIFKSHNINIKLAKMFVQPVNFLANSIGF